MDFDEFIKYLDILINGDQKEKNECTFKLIDYKKCKFFNFSDFKTFIKLMVDTWFFVSGNTSGYLI